jgi:hypothetical protein
MIKFLINGTKRAFGLQMPGRVLDVFPDDTFLVSYPKSGNTLDPVSDREPEVSGETS